MPEPCPFCGKPIVREYGSFRCKHCAGSSEDLIDIERKARVAEIRKHARGDEDMGPLAVPIGPSTISSRLRAIAARSSAKSKPSPKTAAQKAASKEPTRAKAAAKSKSTKASSASAAKPAKGAPAGLSSAPARAKATPEVDAKAPIAKSADGASSKSARLRMVATAHARMAERKKGDAEPVVKAVKKSAKKD